MDMCVFLCCSFFFSSRRRHTRFKCDWSSDVCSSDLPKIPLVQAALAYRSDAQRSLHQWDLWREVRCPVLLIHGLQSDALLRSEERRVGKEWRARWGTEH